MQRGRTKDVENDVKNMDKLALKTRQKDVETALKKVLKCY